MEFLWAAARRDPPRKDDVRMPGPRSRVDRPAHPRDARRPSAAGRRADPSDGTRAPRPARLGDIAILFRALSDVELYEEALRRHGIDYYLVGGHAFYAQQEIFDLLNLLRAVVSPSDGVSLAGVLRSAFFSLADETLSGWRSIRRTGGRFVRGRACLRRSMRQQRERAARAAKRCAALRNAKDRLRICELIELAMSLTGYDATLLAEFLGERKLANMRKVIEQARRSSATGQFDLTDFIAEIDRVRRSSTKEPLAATCRGHRRGAADDDPSGQGPGVPDRVRARLGSRAGSRADRVHL